MYKLIYMKKYYNDYNILMHIWDINSLIYLILYSILVDAYVNKITYS